MRILLLLLYVLMNKVVCLGCGISVTMSHPVDEMTYHLA